MLVSDGFVSCGIGANQSVADPENEMELRGAFHLLHQPKAQGFADSAKFDCSTSCDPCLFRGPAFVVLGPSHSLGILRLHGDKILILMVAEHIFMNSSLTIQLFACTTPVISPHPRTANPRVFSLRTSFLTTAAKSGHRRYLGLGIGQISVRHQQIDEFNWTHRTLTQIPISEMTRRRPGNPFVPEAPPRKPTFSFFPPTHKM